MTLKTKAETKFLSILERLKLAWWVKIVTEYPSCTYYFGPFGSANHAELHQGGYQEDLEQEGAQIVAIAILQGQPKMLTLDEAVPDGFEQGISTSLLHFLPFYQH